MKKILLSLVSCITLLISSVVSADPKPSVLWEISLTGPTTSSLPITYDVPILGRKYPQLGSVNCWQNAIITQKNSNGSSYELLTITCARGKIIASAMAVCMVGVPDDNLSGFIFSPGDAKTFITVSIHCLSIK